jgi:hypothetical protein
LNPGPQAHRKLDDDLAGTGGALTLSVLDAVTRRKHNFAHRLFSS